MGHIRAMRITPILLAIATTNICVCQETAPTANFRAAKSVNSKRLPAYAVYGHFLAWVNQLDKAASASGATDPYKFAEPFSRAHLQSQHLDLIQKEARALDADLRRKDASAQVIIARYRAQGKLALAQGKPLPAVP